MANTVVERNGGGKTDQLAQVPVLGFDGIGVAPDVVAIVFVFGRDVLRGLVGPRLAPWRPEDDERFALKLFDAENREIRWANGVAVLKQFLLNLVELPLRNADGRKYRFAALAVLADHKIA